MISDFGGLSKYCTSCQHIGDTWGRDILHARARLASSWWPAYTWVPFFLLFYCKIKKREGKMCERIGQRNYCTEIEDRLTSNSRRQGEEDDDETTG